MEKNQGESVPKNVSSSVTQHEDGILKVAMQFFAEEILPYSSTVKYGTLKLPFEVLLRVTLVEGPYEAFWLKRVFILKVVPLKEIVLLSAL